jgi:hypothetical protein
MAAYARGAGSQLQIGKESTYGTKATPNRLVNFLSESLRQNVEKIVEDSLMASKTVRSKDIVGKSVDGDFNVILKPENMKELFYLALGVESAPSLKAATSGVYEHEFTPAAHDGSLPSFTAVVDRKAATPAYTGLKIASLSMEANPKDFLRATISVKGKAEESGSLQTGLDMPVLKSFRFVNGTMTIDGSAFDEVTSVNLSIDNALDDGEFTLGSGFYPSEMEHNDRAISIDWECFYNSDVEALRQAKLLTDGATASIVLTFETPEEIESGEKYTIKVELPSVSVDEAAPAVGGKDRIKVSVKGQALEAGGSEAITVTVYDGDNSQAFA